MDTLLLKEGLLRQDFRQLSVNSTYTSHKMWLVQNLLVQNDLATLALPAQSDFGPGVKEALDCQALTSEC